MFLLSIVCYHAINFYFLILVFSTYFLSDKFLKYVVWSLHDKVSVNGLERYE